MQIVYNGDELLEYMTSAVQVSNEHPVLVDKYFLGKEIEIDAVADGEDILIPGIMQHIERAGVHSGDSVAVFPAFTVSDSIQNKIVDYTRRLALALGVKGLINIQFVEYEGDLYIIEVNPRSSRTVPFISKVTGVPMVTLATQVILGKKLSELDFGTGLLAAPGYYAVKAPVFSFAKLIEVDISLGPEMKSTGEVMGVDPSLEKALYKAFTAAGIDIPLTGTMLATIADKDKAEAIPIIKAFAELGFQLIGTEGTANVLQEAGLQVQKVKKLAEGSPNIIDLIRQDKIHLIVNTLTRGRSHETDGFRIRRTAVEHSVPCLTSLDTVNAILKVLQRQRVGEKFDMIPLHEYLTH